MFKSKVVNITWHFHSAFFLFFFIFMRYPKMWIKNRWIILFYIENMNQHKHGVIPDQNWCKDSLQCKEFSLVYQLAILM